MNKTLGEYADAYESPTATKTRVISDLDKVSTKLELLDDNWTNKEGKIVEQKVIVVDNVKYRVPKSVLQQLQTVRKFAPNLEYFRVTRKGTTMDDTEYTVHPA